VNYLANVPEVLDLAKATKQGGERFVFAGGHSVSFIAREFLEHARGAVDCVVRGEGEVIAPRLLEAIGDPRLETLPGVVTRHGAGPTPALLDDLDRFPPARDLGRRRHKYFIGVLDPCASAELTRGCPWDCSFCSAWTFYGRSYRKASPEAAGEDLARIAEPNVFLVDDVAFIHPEHGFAIGREIERRGIRKEYYLETRCDVLIRNEEVFAYWRRLGLHYMFLGVEALDAEGLRQLRKRATPNENFRALEIARRLGRCRFIFFTHWLSGLSEKLRRRLESVFGRSGLAFGDFVTFIPWQDQPRFFGLMQRADVYLDTIGFSGFNTALQAVECGLPIVTREGRFMRGRFASAILKRMGLAELVAQSEEDYVALAVRLARDIQYREHVRSRIAASRQVLFEDLAPIRALEDLLVKT